MTSRSKAGSPSAGPSVLDPASRLLRADLAGGLAALGRPGPLSALAFGALMLLACNVNAVLGHRAVVFKHYYAHAFVLAVIIATACKLREAWTEARGEIAGTAGRALPWFLLFCALIGVSVLVSNGTSYQDMASNYWDADPYGSTSRRIGLPVLAKVLGFERNGYVYFWYGVLSAAFALAWRYLDRGRLAAVEKLSVLSSSIFAYSLVGPGYNEVFVFLLGLLALQFRLGPVGKVVLATMMVATHETATPFVAIVVILLSEREERGQWITILGLLYCFYVTAYLLTWRQDVFNALMTAGKPSPDASENSVGLLLRHPLRALLGVLMAYKLYWALVPAALLHRHTRPMALAVLVSLILAVIGTDTSRLVQFSSLAMLSLMVTLLPALPARPRVALAALNLVIPSLYAATNAEPLWGTGLYSIYLYGAQAAGLGWGRLFVQ